MLALPARGGVHCHYYDFVMHLSVKLCLIPCIAAFRMQVLHSFNTRMCSEATQRSDGVVLASGLSRSGVVQTMQAAKATPSILKMCGSQKLLDQLTECNKLLESVQKVSGNVMSLGVQEARYAVGPYPG